MVAIKPLVKGFGQLPALIRKATLAMVAFGAAAALAGRFTGFRGFATWGAELAAVSKTLYRHGITGGGVGMMKGLATHGGGLGAFLATGFQASANKGRTVRNIRQSLANSMAMTMGGFWGKLRFFKPDDKIQRALSIKSFKKANDKKARNALKQATKQYSTARNNTSSLVREAGLAASGVTMGRGELNKQKAKLAKLERNHKNAIRKAEDAKRAFAQQNTRYLSVANAQGANSRRALSLRDSKNAKRAKMLARVGAVDSAYAALTAQQVLTGQSASNLSKLESEAKRKQEKANRAKEIRKEARNNLGAASRTSSKRGLGIASWIPFIGRKRKGGKDGGFRKIITGVKGLWGVVAKLVGMLLPFLGMLSPILSVVVGLLSFIISPLGIILGLLTVLYVKSENFRNFINTFFGFIGNYIKYIYTVFTTFLSNLWRGIDTFFENVQNHPFWQWLDKTLSPLKKLTDFFTKQNEKVERDTVRASFTKEDKRTLAGQGISDPVREMLINRDFTKKQIMDLGGFVGGDRLETALRDRWKLTPSRVEDFMNVYRVAGIRGVNPVGH